jgi:hypothetical protein
MKTELRKHAFLTARGFEYRECGAWKIEQIDFHPMGVLNLKALCHVDTLFTRLWSENRAVWILCEECAADIREILKMPSSRFHVAQNSSRQIDEEEDKIHISGEIENAREISARISFRPKNADDRTKDCLLLFPEKAEQWEIGEDDDPEVIERALVMLQNHFGRSLVYPPGRLSTYLMEGCRTKAKEQVDYKRRPSNEALQMWVDLNQGDDPLDDWKRSRPFMHAEKKMKYLHAFDKNAMYLQAVGIPLGLGEYRYCRKPLAMHTDEKGMMIPGFWCVRTRPYETVRGMRSNYDNRPFYEEIHFPATFAPPGFRGSEPFRHWVTTPQFKLLCELDLINDIEGAYLAEESSKLFATYYSHIKQSLNLADELIANPLTRPDGSEIVERRGSGETGRMMKRFAKCVYSRGVGYLRAEFARRNGEWFYRPDWWATIVAEAGARLFRDTREVWKESSVWPVAVYVDCLYYASDERDPFKAFPIFADKFRNKFKHKGTCELTKELASAHENGVSPGGFGGMFKAGAEVKR